MKKTDNLLILVSVILLMLTGCNPQTDKSSDVVTASNNKLDRTNLPIQPPAREHITEMDARNATKPERFEVKAPEGAPNVVVVLIDDIGFGATDAYGGAINTPTFERLADNGVRFNQFHTTALCSPTRASLLSGRNHHNVNVGSVMEIATGFPGNQGIRPDNAKYIAEILRQNGYSTAAFGKWHETATWEVSVSGPFFRWPTNSSCNFRWCNQGP
jgi:arylsulfatase